MEKKKLNKILILGSGALKIGEAGEFDYSGSQAIKALREEGLEVILLNPNIATNQTSSDLVNKIYFLPITPYFVEKIIKIEKPEAILLSFGGQTALNCGLSLAKNGIFEKYQVSVLGTPISSVEKTEDRLKFRKYIETLGLKTPKSNTYQNIDEVINTASKINYPVIIRGGFSLGGLGSAVAENKKQLIEISRKAFMLVPQILIEEYLENWKEIEYEVVRDKNDNTIVVCNMENFDPMGIHTGESIVVAPSQTLNNNEYQNLREIAIKVVKNLPIVGECNVQFALNPKNGDYRIIEVNARLSRSSALASKATGYPLAFVAAKLALGYTLDLLSNQVTKATSAFFEPALDYVVIKIPRWNFLQFKGLREETIGSEMQSVGEVMAIGRTFEEALQKGIRSLDLGYEGVISDNKTSLSLKATPSRLYNIANNLLHGRTVHEISSKTGITAWFIIHINNIVEFYKKMVNNSNIQSHCEDSGEAGDEAISNRKGLLHPRQTRVRNDINIISKEILYEAKKLGFSDSQIAKIYNLSWQKVRALRKKYDIFPKVCQIDTMAGEFPAKTNYLYFSYHRDEHDIEFKNINKVAIIGSGPYKIGSSVEFDWCAVNGVRTAREMGFETVVINNNPETVSTDYDISDKLYFEELTAERILDISDLEKCRFIISLGGQIPNNLGPVLAHENIHVAGTSLTHIDTAENREKFSALLDKLEITQPVWKKLTSKKEAIKFAEKIGYPVLIRPSYVLSGSAMFVANFESELLSYLSDKYSKVDNDYPLVISKYIKEAKEMDFDGVSQNGKIIISAISEHVEKGGVHSGDASLVYPAYTLSESSQKLLFSVSQKISTSLEINGPFNIQYLVKENGITEIKVIEANIRASRSMPFISKTVGKNFIEIATKIMLGEKYYPIVLEKPNYTCVKVPHFSFTRLRKVDPILRVEMSSTGEVACFGEDVYEAYLKAFLSTGVSLPKDNILLSLGGDETKNKMLQGVKKLVKLGYKMYCTQKTHEFLAENNLTGILVYKVHENKRPNVVDLIQSKKVSLVINLSDPNDIGIIKARKEKSDGYLIRRCAVDNNIALFTKASNANVFIEAIYRYNPENLQIKHYNEYKGGA